MAINLTAKASDRLSERFKLASCTEGIFSQKYDWTGVATVKVYTLDDLKLNDYNREAVSNRFGNLEEVGDTVQELTVMQDKSFNGAIDKGNNTSQLQIKSAAGVLRQNIDSVIIPELDKYRLKKLAEGAGTKAHSVTLSKTDIVEKLMAGGAAMSNENVPQKDRVIFIGVTTAIKLKIAEQVLGIEKSGEKALVNGVIGAIDGAQVRIVPDSYLPEGCLFIIAAKGAAVAPKKIETFRVLSDHPDIDGHVVQGRVLHDCFVLKAKEKGIYAAFSTAAG
ncbi:MAG: hypothetical protein GX684_02185 [Ruminococcaceae bacterium]|nr:hypothetical protein [Oscillospiraceae bacterium]